MKEKKGVGWRCLLDLFDHVGDYEVEREKEVLVNVWISATMGSSYNALNGKRAPTLQF